MLLPTRILIDITGFKAILDNENSFHKEAVETYSNILDHEQEIWTTSIIYTAIIDWFNKESTPEKLNQLYEILKSLINVLWVDNIVFEEAWSGFNLNSTYSLDFSDWITAIASKKLKASLFTFNDDFIKIGISTINMI